MGFKKIICHWSAGGQFPNQDDREHYHFMVDKNGNIYKGYFKPEDNLDCYDGKYAQHTGGGNTGSIGVAMCGMAGFQNSAKVGIYPLTQKQCEATFKLIADLCVKYGINVTSETVLTHYEFGKKHPNSTSAGKIDITYLPPYPKLKADEVGDFIRGKVNWYIQKGKK